MKKQNRMAGCLAVVFFLLLHVPLCIAEETTDVIRAGRHAVSLEHAQGEVDDLISAYQNTYGIAFTQEDYIHIRDRALNSLATYCIMDNAVEDYGLNIFTEEETDALMKQAEDAYEQTLEYYIADYKSIYDGLMDEDTARKLVLDYLERSGCTRNSLFETAKRYAGYDRLYDEVTKEITITDDAEIQTYYIEKHVEPDRELFADNIEQYEIYTSVYGQIAYYIPDGYRAVSHILLSFPEDIRNEISVCQAKQDSLEKMIESRTGSEEEKTILEDEAARLQAQILTIREKAIPELQDVMDKIQADLDARKPFDELIASYGQDEEMLNYPDGYMVHAQSVVYETEFRDAAMALEQIGEVSEPVLTDSGIHFICYLADVPEGAVELSQNAFESIREEAIETKKAEAFQKALESWGEKYTVTVYPEQITLPDAV